VDEMVRFRGKRLDNGKWVDGCRIEDGHGNIYIGFLVDLEAKPIALARQNGKTANRFKPMGFYLVDSSTAGMGIDIGGKWYFEGDLATAIWYDHNEPVLKLTGEIIFSEGWKCFCIWDKESKTISELNGAGHENWTLEKIGTKWDNPELLGGQNE
jgi:hypothetical protein